MTIDPKNLSATATLTFADEFNSLSLWNGTSGTWTTKYPFAPDKGSTLPSNGEQEWYINSNYAPTDAVNPWTVSNGVLTLTAQPASSATQQLIDGYKYTSGMINTYNSFSQKYGYFEMRAQLPAGQGLWPAFWLLQADGSWPPEIDVMEVLGNDMTTLHTAVHTNQTGTHTSSGASPKVPDMSAGYHTYGVDWEADYITYYFDGQQVFKAPTPADMNEPMYMIANLAVGGYWPGMVNSTTPFPAQMKIDYIHAYTDKGSAGGGTGGGGTGGGGTGGGGTGGGGTGGGGTGGGGTGSVRDRPDRVDRPEKTHIRDRDTDNGTGGGSNPGRDRPDRTHGRDKSDTDNGTQRDDTHTVRDRSDTTHGTQEVKAASHTASSTNDHAGSDTFVFNTRTAGTDRADRSGTDQIVSSHHDGAGSSRFDFDTDDSGVADQSPVLMADHVQTTGVHTHMHSDLLH